MSGIYIPGMEMPKNCDCCDFMTVEGEYGEPTCPFGRIIRCASERHPDCPLVSVPEHGRLIDADALAEHKFVCIPYVDLDGKNIGRAYKLGWNDAIEAIMENAETIIGGNDVRQSFKPFARRSGSI